MLAILKLDAMTQQAAFPEVVDDYTDHINTILRKLDSIFPLICEEHKSNKDIRVEDFYAVTLNKMIQLLENEAESGSGDQDMDEDREAVYDETVTLDEYMEDLHMESFSRKTFYKDIFYYLSFLIKSKASYINNEKEMAYNIINSKDDVLAGIIRVYENPEYYLRNDNVKAAAKSREPYEIAKNELIRILSQYPAETFKTKKNAILAIEGQFLEFVLTRNNGKPKSSNYEKTIGNWSRDDEDVNAAFTRVLKNKRKHQSAEQLDDASQARAEGLFNQLKVRNIHPELLKFCDADFLRNHYQDAVSGAAEYICERLRNMTGLSLDGMALINECFSETDPVVTVNELNTEAECDEQEGIMLLFKGALLAISNIADDESGSVWKEEDVADYFTLLSMLIRKLKTAQVIKF